MDGTAEEPQPRNRLWCTRRLERVKEKRSDEAKRHDGVYKGGKGLHGSRVLSVTSDKQRHRINERLRH
jgi:hypothetical protein